MVVRDGSLVNQLNYQPIRQLHSERYVGRKNMLNSFQDALDKGLVLKVKKDSVVPQYFSVDFDIDDFNDSYKNNAARKYQVNIEAVPETETTSLGDGVETRDLSEGELELGYNPIVYYKAPAFVPISTPPKK